MHQIHTYIYWALFIRKVRVLFPLAVSKAYSTSSHVYCDRNTILDSSERFVFIRVICNSNHYDKYMKLHIRYVFANKWSTKNPLSYNNTKFKLILSLRILIMSSLYEIVFKLIFTRRTLPSYLSIWNIDFLNIL